MNLHAEIHTAIQQLPAEVLPELLRYLQQLATADQADAETVMRLRRILEEDTHLLHRLAQ